ncbi:MAG: hypothetical protein EBX52_10605 [Proteobacteria bacterium]|nr:hypothetical protein [Pseudomonadota bacterium]
MVPAVDDWVRYAQWTRFDPRLGEVWLSAFDREWRSMPPVPFRNKNLRQAVPAVLGVLLDQYYQFLCPDADRKIFHLWRAIALDGVPEAQNEQFFIGVAPFAGSRIRFDAEQPLKIYKRWGFFGRDILLNKFSQKQPKLQRTALAPAERKKALKQLISLKKRITVKDYIEACDGMISRRIAQKDLESEPLLEGAGSTRSRFYRWIGRTKS